MHSFSTPRVMRPLIGALAAISLMAFAPSASAGTIRYTVAASPAYTIEDNGNGIVKVTYNGCVTAGVRQTLNFQLKTNVSGDSNATFNILREEGDNPTATFTPSSVFLRQGPEQTFDASLSFSLPGENNNVTTFRIKLDPESGEGLGQGAGIMVSVPCVVAAAAIPPPAPTSAQAPCVQVISRRGTRARSTNSIRVRVTSGGNRVGGATVRVRGLGVSRSAQTSGTGEVVLRVRPTRGGTLFIQSNVCGGADRLGVRAAQAVTPRFTG